MAPKSGKVRKFVLLLVLLGLLVVVFVLAGGGDFLKSAGKRLEKAGKHAETLKQNVQEKASTLEKRVEKGIDAVKPGEKK